MFTPLRYTTPARAADAPTAGGASERIGVAFMRRLSADTPFQTFV
jgi:hypothetical protein